MAETAPNRPGPDLSRLLAAYPLRDGAADELLRANGALRPVWRPLLDLLSRESPEQLAARFARGDQYLHDTGVYFRQHSGTGSTERNWPLSHVPVMIGAEEWKGLSAGIVQRAELLERVMADLYGAGRLVADGLLPAELVARNPEWLRPMVGVQPRDGHFLHFVAFELGRSPDGSWFVLGDRTQAPSGVGFALENRMATARVFHDLYPSANVERLAGFFRGFRDALNGLRGPGDARVAILTPGLNTDTYFEHAYIARYLGFLLLEASEMKVSGGQLQVQTINGPEPLSVVWRRLDARFADPLELDEDSTLGTPGMVAALRAGSFTMVNSLGSGVLESRALLAFLPRIAERLLGEALKLPNIATWWCGQAAERAYVRDNLARMMIGPALSTRLPFDLDAATALAGRFRDAGRPMARDWLDEKAGALVGQEAVTLSTTPAMIGGRLVPRPMVVRVFAARTREGWIVMPGGYARIGRTEDPTALSMQAGGSVADVWIVSDSSVSPDSLSRPGAGGGLGPMPRLLPARAADNLFWLGRYVERAESAVRLLRAYHLRLEEATGAPLPLLGHLERYLATRGLDAAAPVPPGLIALFDRSRGCAEKVRDRFSVDGWTALKDLSDNARELTAATAPGSEAAKAMSLLLRKLAGLSGLIHDNMYHFTGWRFLTMGRALERAQQTAAMLAAFADPAAPPGCLDLAIELGDSVMSHRRRYSVETSCATTMDLLALDPDNPRSIRFQLDVLSEQEARVRAGPEAAHLTEAARRLLRLQTDLAISAPGEVDAARCAAMQAEIAGISDALTARYLG
ncbi:circularly permuted type 2 ATP-grasp protein [Solirhodobacter olei]|uniref:circularly permuted type 2 ATP-grasp protein n=1 Tax=Solirhodobacter olei TaxID=2493082 RepID=UPI000FDB3932|nr:circularly permuted type 2 ATP-grasp protein [Solirhodobacter olei]